MNAISKRLPFSCENCRRRKIRCQGSKLPCDTCVRRGISTTCRFQRKDVPVVSHNTATQSNEEVLARISNLEGLIKRHIELTSTPVSRDSDDRLTPSSSEVSLKTSAIELPRSSLQRGTLKEDAHGYVRYILYESSPHVDTIDASELTRSLEPSGGQEFCFPFSSDLYASRQSLLERLPPTSQLLHLKETFFRVFSPLFHVLHDPSFEVDFVKFISDPDTVKLSFLALIFVVLALATTALDDEDILLKDLGRGSEPGRNARMVAQRYRTEAMRTLAANHFLWQHDLHTLQALVLLIYAMSHANCPSWSLLGTTFNIAVAIGCHVDPDHLEVDLTVAEERRRSWAALMMLHTIQNTCLGNISPVTILNTVKLPLDVDDECLDAARATENVQIETLTDVPTKMTYILYKFRLNQLASEICEASTRNAFGNEWVVMKLDKSIELEELKNLNRFSATKRLPIYHQAHHHILSSYINHLYIILHRAIVKTTTSQDLPLMGLSSYQTWSLTRCISSASTILSNYETLQTDPRFRPYKWYTYGLGSFQAFFAASMLALLISRGGRGENIDLVKGYVALQRTVMWFQRCAHRSDICAKAAGILTRTIKTIDNARTAVEDDRIQTLDGEDRSRYLIQSAMPRVSVESPNRSDRANAAREPIIANLTGSASHNYQSSDSFDMPGLTVNTNIDLDAWNGDPELEVLLTDLSSHQWMTPAAFPWSAP